MLNHSCTRCRSKKLRCDGSSPCSNCRAKGISHVCQRAQRKERPRKSAVTLKSNPSSHQNKVHNNPSASPNGGQGFPPPQSTSTSSPLVDDFTAGSAMAKLHVRTETDERSTTASSESGHRSPLSSSSSSSTMAAGGSGGRRHTLPVFTPAPTHFRGCLVTQKMIAEARQYVGTLHPALRLLNYVFQWRCQSMAHSCVHLPTIKHTLKQLFSDEWAPEIAQDQLALALMAVAMSIQFSPRRGPYAHVFQVVQALGPALDPGERQQRIHQLARSIVQSRLLDTNTSLEGVQTIVLLLIYDLDEESFKERLWMSAVRAAQALRLNHIQHDMTGGMPSLESELGVRTWWFLVCRDWLYSLAHGNYKLHPSQFTTRLPMIITDEDLAEGKTPNRQAGEVSPVSVSIAFIGLASLIRQLVDIKPERSQEEFSQDVADAFDTFVEGLPYVFSLSTTHIASLDDNLFTQQRLESERWLLHQQIFHAYLHFDELRLDRPICPQMVALASHTLQLQDRVRARCHIIDAMRINVTGVLRAITVLTIDLLQKHRDSKVSLARQVTLGKIREAIHKCETSPNLAEGDLDNVYKLVEMEESAWIAKSRSMPPRISFYQPLISSPPADDQGMVVQPHHRPMTQQQQQQQQPGGMKPSMSFSNGINGYYPSQKPLQPGSSSSGDFPRPVIQTDLATSSQTSLTSAPESAASGAESSGVGSSVGTTSPVVDMPVVPMDLPSNSSSDGQQQQQPRSSVPSVLMTHAEHAQEEAQERQRAASSRQSPHRNGPSHPYQHQQQQQHPQGYQNGPSFYTHRPSVNGHGHGHDPQIPRHPSQVPVDMSTGGGGSLEQHHSRAMHGIPHQHMNSGYNGLQQPGPTLNGHNYSMQGQPPPHNPHAGYHREQQAPQPAPQQMPQQPHQYLDVAQWASLVPSDQALSPIFAPDLLAANQPSLEDLYATFIT